MISRVAESCFWLTRYLERADNVARLLRVNRALVLDAELGWMPLIVVVGEKDRYEALFDDADGEHVQNYLTWDERSPVSIMSSIRWMRENARMIREVMSLESWQCANRFWTWLCSDGARARYHDDTHEFYARVTSLSVEMQGWTQNTMMHDRPLDFMSLGRSLERASQTARTLDVKYHMLGATKSDRLETPLELAEWVALLNSCSAAEPFFKRKNDTPRGPRVAEFLLFDADLPRSIRHCVAHARELLLRIRKPLPDGIGDESLYRLLELHEHLEKGSIETVLQRGIHEELTFVVDSISEICNQVHFDYFDPQPAPP
ncbi:MAG: alpha-E domain-containing protein [Myxococcota bacterium]